MVAPKDYLNSFLPKAGYKTYREKLWKKYPQRNSKRT